MNAGYLGRVKAMCKSVYSGASEGGDVRESQPASCPIGGWDNVALLVYFAFGKLTSVQELLDIVQWKTTFY